MIPGDSLKRLRGPQGHPGVQGDLRVYYRTPLTQIGARLDPLLKVLKSGVEGGTLRRFKEAQTHDQSTRYPIGS